MPTFTPNPERDAQEILKTVWLQGQSDIRLPVDPFFIAKKLGLNVYLSTLEEDVSGMLVKRAAYDDPEIYLNAGDSRNRQRFTCAHELGHYVKRTAMDGADEIWEYVDRRDNLASTGRNQDEIYANQFAANLLMPRDLVTKLKEEYGTAALAAQFGVSADAMKFRIDNLRNT